MSVIFENGAYAPVTLKIDAHGCLHMWEGSHLVYGTPLRPTVDGKEAETFVQHDYEVEAIIEHLPQGERDSLNRGWPIVTRHIPDDYLIHE